MLELSTSLTLVVVILLFFHPSDISDVFKQVSVQGYHKSKYLKQVKLLQEFEKVDSVPKVVWCFWFGPPMSDTRMEAYKTMKHNLEIPVKLVTEKNLRLYELREHPIHRAVYESNLSGIHKGDYLRAYFMRYYGGGYHDIKFTSNSWLNKFDIFMNKDVWLLGTAEFRKTDIGCDPETAITLQRVRK